MCVAGLLRVRCIAGMPVHSQKVYRSHGSPSIKESRAEILIDFRGKNTKIVFVINLGGSGQTNEEINT